MKRNSRIRCLLLIGWGILVVSSFGCLARNRDLPFSHSPVNEGDYSKDIAAADSAEHNQVELLTANSTDERLPINLDGELFPSVEDTVALETFNGSSQFAAVDDSIELSVSPKIQSTWRLLLNDQKKFYSAPNVRPAALTLGASAVLSNTSMDQEFADWYQSDVRSEASDEIAKVAKVFGEQWPMMGAYAAASLTGRLVEGRLIDEDSRLSAWGDQSIRSMLVGVPPLLFLQKAIGSSRPNDIPPASGWNFWNDENGASGHTFVGAVPFLVAAQLTDDRRWKTTLTALSTFTGWSRINDNDHYLSQVVVGWWLAYAATRCVERSDDGPYEIRPIIQDEALGLEFDWNF